MRIAASVRHSSSAHDVIVSTGDATQRLVIPAKQPGPGFGVNGGEFLMLALATCFCNDLYREAAHMGVTLERVEVEAAADFPGVGLAATNSTYRATVTSHASTAVIGDLVRRTDAVAEVHNTLRAGAAVQLVEST